MSKKKLTVVLGLLFLLVMVVLAILLLRYRILTSTLPGPLLDGKVHDTVGQRVITQSYGEPILKIFLSDSEGINYRVRGAFTALNKNEEDNLISGEFVVEDDPLNRELSVIVGMANGNVMFVEYDGSFDSDWHAEEVLSEDVVGKVTIGELVELKFKMPFSRSNSSSVNEYIKEREDLMDTIIFEFQTGEFEKEMPDIKFYSESLGVVR